MCFTSLRGDAVTTAEIEIGNEISHQVVYVKFVLTPGP